MPSWIKSAEKTQEIGLLLFDRFSNHCLANAVEPLRAANMLSARELYSWQFLTIDGAPVTSSSGLRVTPQGRLAEAEGKFLFVMPSYDFMMHATPPNLAALRSASQRFSTMAGLDTGSWLLAAAGMLDGKRATIHWEELTGFAEQFPDVFTDRQRFIIDGDRITCGGALAAFDLVLHLIASSNGEALRLEIAALFMAHEATGRVSDLSTPTHSVVARAVSVMQANLEQPLSINELSQILGRPQKYLEAKMKSSLGATPQAVYRRFRLILARKLAVETDISVAEIAVRCGYQDPGAMSRAFRAEFGISPRAMRRSAEPS